MIGYQLVLESTKDNVYLWIDNKVYPDLEYTQLKTILKERAYNLAAQHEFFLKKGSTDLFFLVGDVDGVFGRIYFRDLYLL